MKHAEVLPPDIFPTGTPKRRRLVQSDMTTLGVNLDAERLSQQRYGTLGKLSHSLVLDQLQARYDSVASQVELDLFESELAAKSNVITSNDSLVLAKLVDWRNYVLSNLSKGQIRDAFWGTIPLAQIIAHFAPDFIDQASSQLNAFPQEVVINNYILWATILTQMHARDDRQSKVLFREVPLPYPASYKGKDRGQVDALEIVSIKGQSPNEKELAVLYRLTQKSYPSIGAALHAVTLQFGPEIQAVIHEIKTRYSAKKQHGLYETHREQLLQYLDAVYYADLEYLRRRRDAVEWISTRRVAQGILHYWEVPQSVTDVTGRQLVVKI